MFGVFAQGYHGGEGGMVQVEVVCQMMDKYGYGKESPCQCSGAIWLALVWSVVFRNRFPVGEVEYPSITCISFVKVTIDNGDER